MQHPYNRTTNTLPLLKNFVVTKAFVVALAFLVVILEEPALSEVEWGICCCVEPKLGFNFIPPPPP
jgi:hypothetical protein